MQEADIAIIGGGLAGMAAANIAAKTGLSIAHFAPIVRPDLRTSALMQPSVDILVRSGLVKDPAAIAEPLKNIRIIDATKRLFRAPETLFEATEAGLDVFGWNFPNAALLHELENQGKSYSNLTTLYSPVANITRTDTGFTLVAEDGSAYGARLLVGADGKNSRTRKFAAISTRAHTFAQSALVCDLELERPLEETSVEFHYENGPFTLVPAGGNLANLVWIDTEKVLLGVTKVSTNEFRALLAEKSQHLFGAVRVVNKPIVFPLTSLTVSVAGAKGVVLVGEAAHAFPPLGAQGLNLGLRDVADLATALENVHEAVPHWAHDVSDAYAKARSKDLARTGKLVDTLFKSLISEFLPIQAGRAAGLWSLKLLPILRSKAFAVGMGAPQNRQP